MSETLEQSATEPPEVELRDALAALCKRFGIAELYVFGSRAREVAARVRGQAAPPRDGSDSSDIDIGVRPAAGVRLGIDKSVEFTQELERLFDAPRVDLVLLPRAKAFLALDVIRGELLYCADPDEQAEYELYVLRRAGDLAPFQKAREEMVLSRFGAS
jgi:predicted nucleotidyltransferase